jgi:hypothetical protein
VVKVRSGIDEERSPRSTDFVENRPQCPGILGPQELGDHVCTPFSADERRGCHRHLRVAILESTCG